MSLVVGTNAGFVISAPSADPAETQARAKGRAVGFKVTSPSGTNKIVEFGWYCSDGADVDEDWEMGLYTDDVANDLPEDLIDTVGQGTLTVAFGEGWQTVSVDIAFAASTTYWICLACTQNSSFDVDYDLVSTGGSRVIIDGTHTVLPDPFDDSPSFTDDDAIASFYAKYEAVAGGIVVLRRRRQ